MEAQPHLIPVRRLNEHVYCPRLAYLEWVGDHYTDNANTLRGSDGHRHVDREPQRRRGDTEEEPPPRTTSVQLASERLGISAKLDVVEERDGVTIPVEFKAGRPKSADEPLWEPELIQLMAQALLLREIGRTVPQAEVYFLDARSRHCIDLTSELEARTLAEIDALRETASRPEPPPPLVDSPKCPHCVLIGLCLPDEVGHLRGDRPKKPRRLVAGDPAARPLYLSEPGTRLTKRGGRAVLTRDGEVVSDTRLLDVSHVAVFGNVGVSAAFLRWAFDQGVPVLWFTHGGWFKGHAGPLMAGDVELRARQHRAAVVEASRFASAFVAGKIKNCRTMLRRHGDSKAPVLEQLAALAREAELVDVGTERLLGLEGTAARLYFQGFAGLLRGEPSFSLRERNRRPPRDPVNAMLSLAYALLIKEATVALVAAGLDPYLGMYHRPRFGRPALALDLAEEFRPLIADSAILRAVNNGEVTPDDFISRMQGVSFSAAGRRRFIAAFERRMNDSLTHPQFGYRASYRRTLEIQARMLAAVLAGDLGEYRPLTTR